MINFIAIIFLVKIFVPDIAKLEQYESFSHLINTLVSASKLTFSLQDRIQESETLETQSVGTVSFLIVPHE